MLTSSLSLFIPLLVPLQHRPSFFREARALHLVRRPKLNGAVTARGDERFSTWVERNGLHRGAMPAQHTSWSADPASLRRRLHVSDVVHLHRCVVARDDDDLAAAVEHSAVRGVRPGIDGAPLPDHLCVPCLHDAVCIARQNGLACEGRADERREETERERGDGEMRCAGASADAGGGHHPTPPDNVGRRGATARAENRRSGRATHR